MNRFPKPARPVAVSVAPVALVAAAVLAAASLFSCASSAPVAAEGLSYEELVQRAQEASDAYRYANALDWYRAAKGAYGADPAVDVACDYEIAFLQYKMGDYALAEAGLRALLARFEGPEGAALPSQYRVLAEKVLPTVLEHTGGE